MTHKQKCLQHCKDYLTQRNLLAYYCSKEFERIYSKGGSIANPYSFGLSTGDAMIRNAKPHF